ncbi:polysaccharide biosynthesis/export family protein [Echinimonas agarilytica]|uniref:Polysaccharide export protein n=1 Tax=Echinimonas agarilytica TaxID=1215918 RepID=A0AA42B5Y9_9GAMM|nr:polysaccharide biosynthesis/export family protein [Echinimonas agarilytica]MCM2678218.1 polysaccharide export protein [Echinimonas agarilytica]
MIEQFFTLLVLIVLSWAVGAAEDENSYRLNTGDTVAIVVFGEDDLQLQATLGQKGTFNYPYLGTVKASGMTVDELSDHIANGLRGDYLLNPSVHVSVEAYRSFFIHGQVSDPGAYAYRPNLTIERAVTLASGFTERASRSNIIIKRLREGRQIEIDAELNTKVKPGDAVYVKQSLF